MSKKISPACIGTQLRFLIFQAMLVYLMLDHFNSPGWVQGMAWTALAFLQLGNWACFISEDWYTPKDLK